MTMSPAATRIEEEGVYIDPFKLVDGGRFREQAVRALLTEGPYAARDPAQNIADLKAQVSANAKGVATRSVLLKHALKNAGVPIVTVIGIGVALLIGGVVITETVFNIPGVGRLVVDAISKRDYPIIQGVILIFSGVYVLVNLLVDLSYTLLDPRIRY